MNTVNTLYFSQLGIGIIIFSTKKKSYDKIKVAKDLQRAKGKGQRAERQLLFRPGSGG